MTLELVHTILDWLQTHSVLANLIVFLTALTESLALVGLIIPGAVLMVIFGALIATGHLEFSHVFIAACAGAIIGDGASYWLGKYYQQQLTSLWPLNRHPEIMEKGAAFFQKHGGKSILLGRFIGPIRPVIPAIAGMLNMRFSHFTMINIFSALLWAPLYLLPGILIGTSLELASELAGRFALLLLFLLFSLWLTYQIVRFLYSKITPHTDRLLFVAMNWNRRHPVMGKVTSSIIDPHHREVRGLTLLILLLFFSSLFAALLFAYAFKTGPVQNINILVFNAITNIQSPPFDWLLQWFSRLGERSFLFIIIIAFSVWLAWERSWVSIIYLLSALLVPLGIITALTWTLSWTQSLPGTLAATANLSDFNLPSGHSALALSVYGFIAIILARRFSIHARFAIYIGIAWLVSIIGFTRIYYATHLLTDVIAGFLLGLTWLSIISIAYRRHNRDALIKVNKILLTSMLVVILTASYPYNSQAYPDKTYSNNSFEQYYIMTDKAWFESGWQSLPSYRQDLKEKNQHPFNLQWVGKTEKLISPLLLQGWQHPDTNAVKFAQWFNPLTLANQLPLLPHVHDGRYDDIRLYKMLPDKETLLVLRLWKSDTLVTTNKNRQALWIGNLSYVKKKNVLLLSYLYTSAEFNRPLSDFIHLVRQPELGLKNTIRKDDKVVSKLEWDGRVLLLSE